MPVKDQKSSKKEAKTSQTPLMKQYYSIKGKYPDALLLFRVGDFYETFSEDAVIASRVLGIVLTQRKNGAAASIELAGFPHHSLEAYLPKLVRAGYRVAICDQLEDPKMTKTIVKRGVTELVTPGVAFSDQVLDHKTNNFLAAVHFEKFYAGVAFLDVSTGEFLAAEGNFEYIDKLLQGFKPSEILYQRNFEQKLLDNFGGKFHTFRLDDWVFTPEFGYEKLLNHFRTSSLKGFGVEGLNLGLIAAGAVLHYLSETHNDKVSHITKIARIERDNHVWLDRFTVRNLELLDSPHQGATTLFDVLDNTISPMGSRMLKRWMLLPLKSAGAIAERHSAVGFFISHPNIAESLAGHISKIGDLERLISKVAVGKINPREILQLRRALAAVEPIVELLNVEENPVLQRLSAQLDPCTEIAARIDREILPDAPVLLSKGGVIADGVSAELDELRDISLNGKDQLLKIQQREIENTGITSLKIAFNNVFGYYIEVRNTHKEKVPAEWIRKQTLVNAERYVTDELKQYEAKILGAEEKILSIEQELFANLVMALGGYIEPIQQNAQLIARLDCLMSFAAIAIKNNYCKPEISEEYHLNITAGRHPVIEKQLPLGEEYVSNDVYLDRSKQQIMMITGPNMSGKSALLRQTALIVLMAQIGSYVPADAAEIGLVDKIFTRVGASDNISSGESTFMVEMNETASILNNLSDRSLILLDEIGRGTSTYDGISIAWAIAEYLFRNSCRAKTLFATHYHELNEMSSLFDGIVNYNVSVKELNDSVIFLRKLRKGGSEHSFGIHVARMAGMPKEVVSRAGEILQRLEESHVSQKPAKGAKKGIGKQQQVQLSMFQLEDPVLAEIRTEIHNLDINSLTPVEALMKLSEIKKLAEK